MNYKNAFLTLSFALASLVSVPNLHASAPAPANAPAPQLAGTNAASTTASAGATLPAAGISVSDGGSAAAAAASAHAATGASGVRADEKRGGEHDGSFSTPVTGGTNYSLTRFLSASGSYGQSSRTRRRTTGATVEDDSDFDAQSDMPPQRNHGAQTLVLNVGGGSQPTRAATPAEIRSNTVAHAVSGVHAKHQASDEERKVFSEQTPEERANKRKVNEEMFREQLDQETQFAEIARKRQEELEDKWEAEDDAKRDRNRSKAEKAIEEKAALQKKQYDARKKALQDPFLTRVADGISEGIDQGVIKGVETIVAGAIVTPFAHYGKMAFDKMNYMIWKKHYDSQAAAQQREETLLEQRDNVRKDSVAVEHYAKAGALTAKGPIQDQLAALKEDEVLANGLLRCVKKISKLLDGREDKKQDEDLEELLEEFDELKEKFTATAMPSFFKGIKKMQDLQKQADAEGKAALKEKVAELRNGFMLFSQLEDGSTVKAVLKDKANNQLLVSFVKANRSFKVSEQVQVREQVSAYNESLMNFMSECNTKLSALNQVDMARLNAAMGEDSSDDQEEAASKEKAEKAALEEKKKKEAAAQPQKVAEVLAAANPPADPNVLKAATA